MKKLLLLIAFFSISFFSFSQALFTYGNNVVTKDEFLKAYNKNKTATTDKEHALRDYLDLYIKFKLKVQAAKELRLDTLPALEADLQNFSSQIEDSYLKDNKEVDILTNEAYTRSKKDIHTSHFFVSINSKM